MAASRQSRAALAAEITARQRKRWPYGKRSKKRVVPMSRRIQALLEPYFSLNDKWFHRPAARPKGRSARRRACPYLAGSYAACAQAYLRHASDSEGHFPGRDSENP